MKSILRLSCIAAALFASSGAYAECYVQANWFVWGGDASFNMTTSPGQSCGVSLNTNGSVSAINIVSQPKNGKADVMNLSGFVYVPKKGFVGTDSFVVRAVGQNFRSSGPSNFTLNVTVQ